VVAASLGGGEAATGGHSGDGLTKWQAAKANALPRLKLQQEVWMEMQLRLGLGGGSSVAGGAGDDPGGQARVLHFWLEDDGGDACPLYNGALCGALEGVEFLLEQCGGSARVKRAPDYGGGVTQGGEGLLQRCSDNALNTQVRW
jgi:hypothetical protein